MKRIKVSAPGKLMLLGEHAVIYGYPCLVTAVDTRLYIEAEEILEEQDIVLTPQVKESSFVKESLRYFKKRFKIEKSVKIKTDSNFSHQVGLGSSSAVTVATFKALSILFEKPLTLKEIFNLSYHVSLTIQKTGSGFDIAAATYGKIIYFIYAGKVIKSLNTEELPLVVGYSGNKADTPKMIKKVAEIYKKEKERVKSVFHKINKLVELGKTHILNKNYQGLGLLMSENHLLLKDLNVSTPKLDVMVDASLKAGAWGAKLSGAGGGDCMIALVPPKKRYAVEETIKSVGGEVINVNNNAKGARLENLEKNYEGNCDCTSQCCFC